MTPAQPHDLQRQDAQRRDGERPDYPRRGPSTRTLVTVGLLICLLLSGVVSFYASGHPDGLEYVAGKLGFDTAAGESASADSPLADYGVSGVDNARLSGGLAGILGVVLVAILAFGLTWLLRRRSPSGDR